MGCGASSNIVINFDRTNLHFFGGEIVSGSVQLYVTDDKLEADEIDFNLIGEAGYTRKYTTTENGETTTRTEQHDVPFLSTKYVFARPTGGEKQLTYSQGQYSWPFQIQLPDYLPPTIGLPNNYPHVRYYLQVVIDKAWYKSNTRENRYITVSPRVNILQPNYSMATVFGNHNRKDMVLKGSLNKQAYLPGEMIQGIMEVDNPKGVLIKQIDVSMIENYQIECEEHTYIVTSCIIPEMMCRRERQIVQPFGIMIPSRRLLPSYHYQGGLKATVTVNISYTLKFDVKVEGMFTDFDVSVPITIGNDPMPYPPPQ
jgi:sporulation-control protein spo0M